ncbi:CCC motif membrane protein [Maribacter litoralis]|uniref:CCC motif membrane protein n=1 Tax=Maribacter litoralis TaxID=2059726 RepID=UPI003D2C9584
MNNFKKTFQLNIAMESKKLPNSAFIYVLSVLSCIICCLGGFGIISAVISYYLASKSEGIYKMNPEAYDNYATVKKGKIIAIIGIVLNVIVIGITIWTLSTIGWDAWSEEFVRKWNEGLERGM